MVLTRRQRALRSAAARTVFITSAPMSHLQISCFPIVSATTFGFSNFCIFVTETSCVRGIGKSAFLVSAHISLVLWSGGVHPSDDFQKIEQVILSHGQHPGPRHEQLPLLLLPHSLLCAASTACVPGHFPRGHSLYERNGFGRLSARAGHAECRHGFSPRLCPREARA